MYDPGILQRTTPPEGITVTIAATEGILIIARILYFE